ncbi:MAG: VCBS repeat-containing protein, partial [Deltaproteobacteria bacterium]
DLDRDGDLDLVSATTGLRFGAKLLLNGIRFEHEHHVGAWDIRTKRPFPSFPRIVEDLPFFLNPAIADLDGDGFPEIVAGSSGYLLHAWNVRGVEPAGWPKFTGGWLLGSPAVGDVDGDGRLEVVAVTMEGNLYLWDTPGPATTGAVSWGGFHHDARNSGNFETPLP